MIELRSSSAGHDLLFGGGGGGGGGGSDGGGWVRTCKAVEVMWREVDVGDVGQGVDMVGIEPEEVTQLLSLLQARTVPTPGTGGRKLAILHLDAPRAVPHING